MKHLRYIMSAVAAIVMAATSLTVAAQVPPRPDNADKLIYDYANVIDSSNYRVINDSLNSLYNNKGCQVVVLTVNSLEGMDEITFAQEVFDKWGIGDKEDNNGVLILVKPKTGESVSQKGQIRIHSGYGAEGALPDLLCKRIQTDSMIPDFKNGNYGLGIRRAVSVITPIMKGEYPPEYSALLDKNKDGSMGGVVLYVVLYLLIWGAVWYYFFMPTKLDGYSIKTSPYVDPTATSSDEPTNRNSRNRPSSRSNRISNRTRTSSTTHRSWGGGSSGGGGASSSW